MSAAVHTTLGSGFACHDLFRIDSLARAVGRIGEAEAIILAGWACGRSGVFRGVEGVPCSVCSYDLRGQRVCRSPECSGAFTLGELAVAIGGSEQPPGAGHGAAAPS